MTSDNPLYRVREVKTELDLPQEGIARLVMDSAGATPATPQDYHGKRLDPEKAEELYDKLYQMRLRGVENKNLLSRTLGVSYNTIVSWCYRFDAEMRRKENDRSTICERNKMLERLTEIQRALWGIYETEEVSEGVKVSALNTAITAIKRQAELSGVLRTVITQQEAFGAPQHLDQEQIEQARKLALGIKELIAAQDQA